MQPLNVTIVQATLAWHDPEKNRATFAAIIDGLAQPTDLIVLPEMFTTGFTMDATSNAETMAGPSVAWMRGTASRAGAAVCGSLIIEEQGCYYNRFVCASPDGSLARYDKRHLFRLASEQEHYSPGRDFVVFELKGWRVCPMVCYDLRFPVWSRNRNRYDLLLYVANWPSPRHLAWTTLCRARAIENQAYVAAVNRAGTDDNGLPYSGGSAVIDFLGQTMADLGEDPGTATVALDPEALAAFRERYPFHMDADDFTLDR